MKRLRIATRGSDLARAQASWVAEELRSRFAIETETIVIKTTGDTIQDKSLAKVGGKGLFVKELEEALLEERADIAVHSAGPSFPSTSISFPRPHISRLGWSLCLPTTRFTIASCSATFAGSS